MQKLIRCKVISHESILFWKSIVLQLSQSAINFFNILQQPHQTLLIKIQIIMIIKKEMGRRTRCRVTFKQTDLVGALSRGRRSVPHEGIAGGDAGKLPVLRTLGGPELRLAGEHVLRRLRTGVLCVREDFRGHGGSREEDGGGREEEWEEV